MTPQPRCFAVLAMTLCVAVVCAACSSQSSPSGPGGMVITPDRINGSWTLLTLQPQGQPETGPPAGAMFVMEIAGGRAAVRADCNRCSGPAIVGGTTLTVGPAMACTRAFCASAPLDDVFLRILSGESTASIEGDVLALRADRGILRFRR